MLYRRICRYRQTDSFLLNYLSLHIGEPTDRQNLSVSTNRQFLNSLFASSYRRSDKICRSICRYRQTDSFLIKCLSLHIGEPTDWQTDKICRSICWYRQTDSFFKIHYFSHRIHGRSLYTRTDRLSNRQILFGPQTGRILQFISARQLFKPVL